MNIKCFLNDTLFQNLDKNQQICKFTVFDASFGRHMQCPVSFSCLCCDPGERAIQNCIDDLIPPRDSQHSCVGSIKRGFLCFSEGPYAAIIELYSFYCSQEQSHLERCTVVGFLTVVKLMTYELGSIKTFTVTIYGWDTKLEKTGSLIH